MNLPIDFTNRMKEYLGEEYEAFIASYDEPEVKGLRLNALAPGNNLGAICNWMENARDCGTEFFKVPWCEEGYYYFNSSDESIGLRPGKHPYHEAGAYYIQEPSAMAPVTYLNVEKGDRVLDLCAAPGGKSTQIAAALKGEGILITNEIMPDRARILSENIERMGVRNALVISEDPRNISDRFAGFFDKVLVDAPCSGEGMFRRLETAVNEWSLNNVKLCADRQSWILDEAVKMLSPGGTLCYSTCTFSKEENEEQIKHLLERHPELELAEMPLFDGMRRGYDDIGIRIFPHNTKGEGHYICKLTKSTSGDRFSEKINIPYEPDLTKKDREQLKDMFIFIEKTFNKSPFYEYINNRRITRFKDQIYLLPEDCPMLKGLKVLRPGLHLGTILKNRFEPGHALAMSLYPDDIENSCMLSADDGRIVKYLAGETFNTDENETKNPGWNVVFADGFSVGFGKMTNNIMKNHYPKGLRKRI